jgi:acetolactate synthase-1/2/3 large subunit
VRAAEAGRVSHQRLDQAALGGPVAKAVLMIGGDRAGQTAAHAVRRALAAPPGPVIALMDDEAPAAGPAKDPDGEHPDAEGLDGEGPGTEGPDAEGRAQASDLGPLATALGQARRPVLLLGTQAVAHTAAIRATVAGRGIPALHTYRARGIVPDTAAEAGGLVTGGTMEWPLLAQADLIVGLGVDEAEMIPAAWDYPAPTVLVSEWPAQRPGMERGGMARPGMARTGTASYFTGATTLTAPLPAAIDLVAAWIPATGPRWAPGAGRAARAEAARRLAQAAIAAPGTLAPQQVAAVARAHTPPDTIVTVDAGAHMLAVMPLWDVDQPRRLLISSGLATMGFALPAAIAAALCSPGQPVVAFTGDGGLGMTLAEIETAVRLRLRIVVIVFNDATLSLIKIKQRPASQGGAEAVDYGPVSFAGVATAMGAAAAAAGTEAELAAALDAALRRDSPTVIDVKVDPACYPAVMELSRGDAGRRDVPGLTEAGGDANR